MRKLFLRGLAALMILSAIAVPIVPVFAETADDAEQAMVEAPDIEVDEQLNFGTLSEKGKSYTSSFTVRNNSDQTVKLQMEITKAVVGDQYAQAADWLVFVGGKNSYEVAAGVAATVRMRVNVPENAPEGSQYAAVRVKNDDGFDQAVTVRLDVAGNDLRYSGKLQGHNVPALNLDGTLRAETTVENNGTAGFKAKYLLQVRPGFDDSVDWEVITTEEREVKPGFGERFWLQHYATPEFGILRVEQKIAYINEAGESVESVYAQTVICCPWWALVILGAVILLAVLIAIICKIARKKKQSRTKVDKKEK